jgi:hypothetical protein
MGKEATHAQRTPRGSDPIELRRQSRQFLDKAKVESDAELKLHYITSALTLAQLAEKLDRDKSA